jgi:UDP-2,3-diacylglucosamine pyrophosphatase LpxH
MGNVINLRQARKSRARAEKEKSAEANRLAFGRSKAEKQGTKLEKSRADKVIEGHRRDKGHE